jgi:hypothetical protein
MLLFTLQHERYLSYEYLLIVDKYLCCVMSYVMLCNKYFEKFGEIYIFKEPQ